MLIIEVSALYGGVEIVVEGVGVIEGIWPLRWGMWASVGIEVEGWGYGGWEYANSKFYL